MQKRYKPNVVYELLIHGVYHYGGCHCRSKDCLLASEIINRSGNYLAVARDNGFITPQEYRECVELINIWEFDTKEEAQNFETLKIQELKEKYGDLCKNKALYGNQHGTKGIPHSEEHRRKIGEANKGKQMSEEAREKISKFNRGKTVSEETRRKLSEANKGKQRSEETKRKLSEAHKGQTSWIKGKHHSEETRERLREASKDYHWYTNEEINIRAKECPTDFHPGRIFREKKS